MKAPRLLIHLETKMSNRGYVLDLIQSVMRRMKNADSRDQRFTLLDNVQILAGILQEVVQFEQSLLVDMDVD
jgi:hypothetical protein